MVENEPRISVVIPCYNGMRYIGQAIQSVVTQSFGRLELVVVDDGSTDGSKDVIGSFLTDDRVRYIRHEQNKGIPASRNTGIELSSGKYTAFLDQDDFWRRDKLEKQLEVIASQDGEVVGLVFSSYEVIDDRGRKIRSKRSRVPRGINEMSRLEVLRALFMTNFIPIVSCLINRDCFSDVGLLDENIKSGGDDYEFCLRLAAKYKVAYIHEPLVVRRVHGSNFTDEERMFPDDIEIMNRFADKFPALAPLRSRRESTILCKLGGYYQRCGEGRKAKHAYRGSLRSQPSNLKAFVGYGISSLGSLGSVIFGAWYRLRDIASRSGRWRNS